MRFLVCLALEFPQQMVKQIALLVMNIVWQIGFINVTKLAPPITHDVMKKLAMFITCRSTVVCRYKFCCKIPEKNHFKKFHSLMKYSQILKLLRTTKF